MLFPVKIQTSRGVGMISIEFHNTWGMRFLARIFSKRVQIFLGGFRCAS